MSLIRQNLSVVEQTQTIEKSASLYGTLAASGTPVSDFERLNRLYGLSPEHATTAVEVSHSELKFDEGEEIIIDRSQIEDSVATSTVTRPIKVSAEVRAAINDIPRNSYYILDLD